MTSDELKRLGGSCLLVLAHLGLVLAGIGFICVGIQKGPTDRFWGPVGSGCLGIGMMSLMAWGKAIRDQRILGGAVQKHYLNRILWWLLFLGLLLGGAVMLSNR